MSWSSSTRYKTTVKVYGNVYNIVVESYSDDDYAVYINGEHITDVESLPTEEELKTIISDNVQLETTIKSVFHAQGAF